MKKACVVFVTVDTKKTADKITKAVLKERIAACVNAVHGVSSTYWWKGKIEKASEILLILKTRTSVLPALIKRVKALHPYSVPEIIALDIKKGYPDYISWVIKEAKGK